MSRREIVHRCPPKGSGVTPCCGRTPFELPRTDRLTVGPALVTCKSMSDPTEEDLRLPDHFALCETTCFHGRDDDEWFLLEWWGPSIGWAVYEMLPHSIYACDSGPNPEATLAAFRAEARREAVKEALLNLDFSGLVRERFDAAVKAERQSEREACERIVEEMKNEASAFKMEWWNQHSHGLLWFADEFLRHLRERVK